MNSSDKSDTEQLSSDTQPSDENAAANSVAASNSGADETTNPDSAEQTQQAPSFGKRAFNTLLAAASFAALWLTRLKASRWDAMLAFIELGSIVTARAALDERFAESSEALSALDREREELRNAAGSTISKLATIPKLLWLGMRRRKLLHQIGQDFFAANNAESGSEAVYLSRTHACKVRVGELDEQIEQLNQHADKVLVQPRRMVLASSAALILLIVFSSPDRSDPSKTQPIVSSSPSTAASRDQSVPQEEATVEASATEKIEVATYLKRLKWSAGNCDLAAARQRLANVSNNKIDIQRFRALNELATAELNLGFEKDAVEHSLLVAESLSTFQQAKGGDNAISKEEKERLLMQTAVCYLRLAEIRNCVAHCNAQSCILPIRQSGIHKEKEPAREAFRWLERLLDQNPEHLEARWLLNVTAMLLGEYPDAVPLPWRIQFTKFETIPDFPNFTNVAAEAHLNSVSLAGGVVVDDFDGDERLDILTSNWDTSRSLRFFRNMGGGVYADHTKQAEIDGLYGGFNLIQADYDNDGDIDVLVLRGAWLNQDGKHPNSLLQNDGRGRFRDVLAESGLGMEHYPTQTAAFADYDNDGDLDLYFGNESTPGFDCASQLFENIGQGRFRDVAAEAGVENYRWAKGVVWGDFDNDSLPDLFVSNLQEENRLYHNNGDGTFTDVAEKLGVQRPLNSFLCWFWDYDNDGCLDLFVGSYAWSLAHVVRDYVGQPAQMEFDGHYRGDGKGEFQNVTQSLGLQRVTLPMGGNFGDLDNDGFLDFYLGTGYPGLDALMPNQMWLNCSGERFADVTSSGGFGHLQKGHGVSFADLDNDGDQDVFAQLGGFFPADKAGDALFQNPGFANHWIQIRLEGVHSNRSALGARIRVDFEEAGRNRTVYRWVTSGGSFGANPLRQEIGLGSARLIDRLQVTWPTSGMVQEFRDLEVDQRIHVVEGSDRIRRIVSDSPLKSSRGMP